MECPSCGFQQPEEEYCARCGVNLRQALRRRQKRMLVGLLATILLAGCAALVIVLWFPPERVEETPPSPPPSSVRPTATTASTPPLPQRRSAPRFPGKKPRTHPAPTPTRERPEPIVRAEPQTPPDVPTAPAVAEAPGQPQTPADTTDTTDAPPSEPDPEGQIRRWAAQEWFAKGQELADNSEEELSLYQKALDVDPHFAPAHYFMGVIHLEWGDREAALAAFARFWKDATDEERDAYPLPETVTWDELGIQEGKE